jgi:uncharacterized protein YxjI
MKGNWRDSAADIVDESNGMVVAQIQRSLKNMSQAISAFAFGQQTYNVVVAPNVDMALVAAMCICMDEKNNEGKSGLSGMF